MGIFIIAEAGVNHNGDVELAYKMVDEAKKAGVDAIKFQTFKSELLASKFSEKAEYQAANDPKAESQKSMLKRLELSYEDFIDLKRYCDKVKIQFLSTPFDLESIDFLNGIGMEIFKIPSGEITNLPYLRKINTLKKKVILSTGMSGLGDIERALEQLQDCHSVSILHCTTEYPTPFEDVNLNNIKTLAAAFDRQVGYSDHTPGIEISVAAAAMGAHIIEKHFTLDRNMEGPDHKASLATTELYDMVQAIRNVEKALGSRVKRVTASEQKNISVARKSIVAKTNITKGDILSENNLTVKRPGNGISPMMWDSMIGKEAKRNYEADELIIDE